MIKLFLCDVDGTLTDGIYHTSEKGLIAKSFFTRDFHGLWMLNKQGIKVVFVTAAEDDVIDIQCSRAAPYVHIYKGIKNKLKFVSEDQEFRSYNWSDMAFMGDDAFDRDLLNVVSLAGCPIDASVEIIKLVEDRSDGFVSRFPAGRGAVRDFAEYICKKGAS